MSIIFLKFNIDLELLLVSLINLSLTLVLTKRGYFLAS